MADEPGICPLQHGEPSAHLVGFSFLLPHRSPRHADHDDESELCAGVTSDLIADSFSGLTFENSVAGDLGNKPPIPAGAYDAFIRHDRKPNRIELRNVPGYSNIQVHPGNIPRDFKGCFAFGSTARPDYIGGTTAALGRVLDIIRKDASGQITVFVGPPTPAKYVPFEGQLIGLPTRLEGN